MARVRNDQSLYVKDWTDKKLEEELHQLHSAIYQIECFGVRDIWLYTACIEELEKRGHTISEKYQLEIN